MNRLLSIIFATAVCTLRAWGQAEAPPLLHPDERYKADLLLVVAHPDDDVVVGGYLARIALDDRKRIAVIYCTPGDGGGNAAGNEAGAALGQMRIIEARRALGAWGIQNVWFLGRHDTPGQNVLWSLDGWNHGWSLDAVVRLVRLTRPNVILTFLPDHVAGENHDDHQAAGVLATEAFDAAGDPTQFPEQVSAARNRTGMMNRTEGLAVWQPQKLYYFVDAFEDFGPYWHDPQQLSPFRPNMMDGQGPSYETTAISPSRHVSYAKLTAEQQVYYATQEGDIGERALKSGNLKDFEYPVRLIFGKSVVGGSVTGDVFESVSSIPAPFAKVPGYVPEAQAPLSFAIGDPWRFYSLFWKAHGIDHIRDLLPVPEVATAFGQTLHVPFLICNHTSNTETITVTAALPERWTNQTRFTRYPVQAGECYPAEAVVTAPPNGKTGWQQLTWKATARELAAGEVTLRVLVGNDGGLPQ